MSLEQLSTCADCPLYHHGRGFSAIEGTGANGVLILGEALGENEFKDGLPFRPYAQAGAVLERAFRFAGVTRQQFAITNTVRCFSSHRTRVMTSKGPQELWKTKGELVLTHLGRFRLVLDVIHNRVEESCVGVKIKTNDRPINTQVTLDHRFRTPEGQWVSAFALRPGMQVMGLGEFCVECGNVTFRHHSKQHISLPFCSKNCHNRFVARKAIPKMRQNMLDAYKTGKRDAYAITQAANQVTRQMIADGCWQGLQGLKDEQKRRRSINSAIARQLTGLQEGIPWIGFGEAELADLLNASGIEFTAQFAVGPYNFDFRVGNTLIEVDGPSARTIKDRGNRIPKEKLAQEQGYSVVHVQDGSVEEALTLLANDFHDFEFVPVEVMEVTPIIKRFGSWTLHVEEDHSYIAAGVQNHNCQPPYNELLGQWYEFDAINHCKQYTRSAIQQYRPRVILALGAIALRTLTGLSGKLQTVDMLQGYPFQCIEYPDVWVIGSYHPSYIARGQYNVFPVLCKAIERAVKMARGPVYTPEVVQYTTDAQVADLIAFYDDAEAHPELPISVDFETNYEEDTIDPSELLIEQEEVEGEVVAHGDKRRVNTDQQITQVNLTLHRGSGLAVQYNELTRDWVQSILALPNDKIGYNIWMFDLLVAQFNGLIINGTVWDGMWEMHHIYPDLPGRKGKTSGANKEEGTLMNLQFAASLCGYPWAWKHLCKSDPGWYGCCDSDAAERVHAYAVAMMKRKGIWEGYKHLVMRMMPVLTNKQRRGIPLNVEKIREFIRMLSARQVETLAAIQPLIPEEVIPVKQKKGLKKVPTKHCPTCEGTGGPLFKEGIYCETCDGFGVVSDVDGLVLKSFNIDPPEPCPCFKSRAMLCNACSGDWKRGKKKSDPETDCKECKKGKVSVKCALPDCPQCKGEGFIHGVVQRWCEPLTFKPTSVQQLKAYAAIKKHHIPKNSKKQLAMDKETLLSMFKKYKDPVYKHAIDYRECTKMRGTYGEGWLRNAIQFEDRHVRTQFTFAPATLQLSCLAGFVPVRTLRGEIPIQDICIGDYVWTHKRRWMPVTAVWLKGSAPMVQIDLSNGLSITCTEDHRFLVWGEGHEQKMVDARTSSGHRKNGVVAGGSDQSANSESFSHTTGSNTQRSPLRIGGGEVRAIETSTLLAEQIRREKPYEGENTPKERMLRWTRVRDIANGRGTNVCAHDNDVQSSKPGIFAGLFCDPSHRWGPPQQQSGQFSFGNSIGASNDSPSTESGGRFREGITVTKTNRVGCLQVFDISVAEDESYEACGVFNHNSVSPNVQNDPSIVKYGALAVQFASAIEARPGYCLLAFDYKSFHAQTLGLAAGDVDYVRLAKLDVHSFVTAHMVRHPDAKHCLKWDDEKLMAFLKEIKKKHSLIREKQAKPGVHGYGFGRGSGSLYRANIYDPVTQAGFKSERDAQMLIDILDAEFSKTAQFRKDTPALAHRDHCLINLYGAMRWFWDVMRWNPKERRWDHGDDYEKTIAYLPASHAFGYVRYAAVRMEENGMNERYGLINNKHDSLEYHCPLKLKDEALYTIRQEMIRPSTVLFMPDGSGFSCDVEAKWGMNKAEMVEVKG